MNYWILRFVSDKDSDTPAMRRDKVTYELGRIADGKHTARITEEKKDNKIIYTLYTRQLIPLGGKG